MHLHTTLHTLLVFGVVDQLCVTVMIELYFYVHTWYLFSLLKLNPGKSPDLQVGDGVGSTGLDSLL